MQGHKIIPTEQQITKISEMPDERDFIIKSWIEDLDWEATRHRIHMMRLRRMTKGHCQNRLHQLYEAIKKVKGYISIG